MLYFENGMDTRCRQVDKPQIARIRIGHASTGYREAYCVIGTQYGYMHTSGGDVRTWQTPSGAYQFLRRYVPL